ncbi:hypothetical protein [Wolbachia endosymbiont (group B) of Ennomos erosarius]|uniref:hypothetical protein n=1 Tax=Wolbachia endosymbiont (group B) of Ennomos erosarius TaxID=3066175 RepID=UPI003133263E
MVNLICFFITAEFTLFSCLFYSPLIQNSRVKGRNAPPVLELTDLGYRRRSSSSSDEEIFTTGDRMRTMDRSQTVLDSISVENSSRSRSSSSSSASS